MRVELLDQFIGGIVPEKEQTSGISGYEMEIGGKSE